jgi:hypothetical protein
MFLSVFRGFFVSAVGRTIRSRAALRLLLRPPTVGIVGGSHPGGERFFARGQLAIVVSTAILPVIADSQLRSL